jgi:thermolysin
MLRLSAFLSVVLFVAIGCSTSPPDDPLASLNAESGIEWRAVYHPITHLVTTVDGYRPRAPTADDGAMLAESPGRALEFLAGHPDLFGAAATPKAVTLTELGSDPLGGARLRFELHVGALRIDGADALVAVDPSGQVRAVSGEFPVAPVLDTTATLGTGDAQRAALAYLAQQFPTTPLALEEPPELIATMQDGGMRLHPAWRVLVSGPTVRREIFVDAVSGQILHERDGLIAASVVGSGIGTGGERLPLELYQSADGTFQLRDDTRGPLGIRTFSAQETTELPGWQVTSASATTWDTGGPAPGAAVNAHYFAGITFDYFQKVLGRDSIDGQGGAVRIAVHYGDRMDNAFWDGHRAVFGDGDGRHMSALSGGLDVVAHEMFHGVTQKESKLIYEGESGALNESLSDVFGTFVELDHGGDNWTIGETIANPPLRDLAHPSRSNSPAHMSQYVQLPADPQHDMGGVHINSTIASQAAYLVAEGGSNEVSGLSVTGIGVTRTRQIWYRAATTHLGAHARFADFAEATHTAAEDLFGKRSQEVKSVDQAWRAVGVAP